MVLHGLPPLLREWKKAAFERDVKWLVASIHFLKLEKRMKLLQYFIKACATP